MNTAGGEGTALKSSIRGVGYRKDAEAEIAVVTAGEGEKDGLNGDAQTGTSIYATAA